MIEDPHTKETIILGNKKVLVWIYGSKKKYPIVFIHGYFRGFSDYIGDLPMRYLSKEYCVYAFDLPGFGYSKNISMDTVEFVDLIAQKLIGGRNFSLFGTSYGGVISLRYAVKFPDRIDGVIVAGAPYGGRFAVLRFLSLPKFVQHTLVHFLSDFKIMNKKNLAQLNRPVLLLYGSSDTRATIGMANKLKNAIPSSSLVVSDRTHGWLLHRIDESGFLEAIKAFLKPFVRQ